jgi:hypothetical protein
MFYSSNDLPTGLPSPSAHAAVQHKDTLAPNLPCLVPSYWWGITPRIAVDINTHHMA